MYKMILSFGIIILGLTIGQLIKWRSNSFSVLNQQKITNFIDVCRKVAFFILNPIIMVNSYWIIDFSNIAIIILPFICVFCLASSGFIGLFISKKLKHSATQKASMFAASTFSNLGTVGGLITFSFFGEKAYSIAAMFIFFESFYNYLICYPLVKALGENSKERKINLRDFFTDPSIVIYMSAVFIGVLLNISNIQRPQIMTSYNEYMIPVVSFLLISAVAYKMEFGKIKSCAKEGILVVIIKYLFTPILGIAISYIFGLQLLDGGLILKVVFIMFMVPCGFNTILVPTIYKADKDIANTAWIFTTCLLLFIVPLEYVLFFVL